MMSIKETVCVTGSGGFLGSWLVKLLLSKGYMVHGTVRDPFDHKNSHLYKLENAATNLKLFKADLLDYQALCSAIEGCSGVFHVASPLPASSEPTSKEQLMEPAVTGTRNVLEACSKAKVKKTVVVSSVAAIIMNPSLAKDRIIDENSWSNLETCEAMQKWYFLSKTAAEREAWDYAKKCNLNIVTVCPSFIIGPLLQSTMNATSLHLLKLLRDGLESVDNGLVPHVDVRDAAESLMIVYEREEAEGRYICSAWGMRTEEMVNKLKAMFPDYKYPKR